MSPQFRLSTSSTEFPGSPASLRLGGVTIYAPGEPELTRAFKTISSAIDQCSKSHSSLTRKTLNSEVRKHLEVNVDPRIFGAILGSQLRLGILDSIPCAAVTGEVFRIYVHNTQFDTFGQHLKTTTALLRLKGTVLVRDIEEKLFGRRRWGTWSSASHILARLVQLGRASYVDRNLFRWPLGIEHAVE
jgi:hypothetical protein